MERQLYLIKEHSVRTKQLAEGVSQTTLQKYKEAAF